MQNARKLDRPVPLVCTECERLIGADEPCTWRERTQEEARNLFGVDTLAFVVPGAIGKHVKCPEVA